MNLEDIADIKFPDLSKGSYSFSKWISGMNHGCIIPLTNDVVKIGKSFRNFLQGCGFDNKTLNKILKRNTI
jgi:hypothetical protein